MMKGCIMRCALFVLAAAGLLGGSAFAGPSEDARDAASPYAKWKNGPPSDPAFFPVAVWLQAPRNAPKYRDLGINLYIGLWDGPTEQQLKELRDAGMPVICHQNEVGLAHKDDKGIVAWMHGDEPDNAQALPGNKGYGPPVLPAKIVEDYRKVAAADPSRPVLLNLGQGVAWDGWIGRGVRTNHPEDYAEYAKGCDIVSFDIYPVNSDRKDVAGRLEYVPKGVDRLREWTGGKKAVWNCIECTPYDGPSRKPTPRDVKAEVWMSLIHGSQGLIYFVHVFKPRFIEAGLLADAGMAEAVKAINAQIRELAPVLNSPTLKDGVKAVSLVPEVLVDAMAKRHGGATYVFAVSMRGSDAKATFTVAGLPPKAVAEVLGENRTIEVIGGKYEDAFEGYGVHLYRIGEKKP
jgi:hypothetical protein